jgi:hypothetical protein
VAQAELLDWPVMQVTKAHQVITELLAQMEQQVLEVLAG